METEDNLFLVLGGWWRRRAERRKASQGEARARLPRQWLPSPGSAIFTVAVVGGLALLQSGGILTAAPGEAVGGASTGTMAYQGRLADPDGTPLTGSYSMIFRLYSLASGGAPLWEETWTGPNSVAVSDGLFNVMLGRGRSVWEVRSCGQDVRGR